MCCSSMFYCTKWPPTKKPPPPTSHVGHRGDPLQSGRKWAHSNELELLCPTNQLSIFLELKVPRWPTCITFEICPMATPKTVRLLSHRGTFRSYEKKGWRKFSGPPRKFVRTHSLLQQPFLRDGDIDDALLLEIKIVEIQFFVQKQLLINQYFLHH